MYSLLNCADSYLLSKPIGVCAFKALCTYTCSQCISRQVWYSKWDSTLTPYVCSKHSPNLTAVLSISSIQTLIMAPKPQEDRGFNITSSRGRKLSSWRAMTSNTVSPCLVLLRMATSSSWVFPVTSLPFT